MFEVAIFTLGLAIGSFLNVCIYRLPYGRSVASPPSHCMECGARLGLWDMIPVISYFLLRGRCRHCGTAFSPRYVVVELLTAVLFVLCFKVLGLGLMLVKALVFTAFLVAITFIDLDHQLILDKVLIWLAGSGVALNLFINSFNAIIGYFGSSEVFYLPYISIANMFLSGVIGGGLMLLIAVVSRGGMGGGDVKFAAAVGLWLGWQFTLLALLLSFLLGGVGGIIVLALKIKGRKDFIPFGPFIAAGALVTMLYGSEIIKWYVYNFLLR